MSSAAENALNSPQRRWCYGGRSICHGVGLSIDSDVRVDRGGMVWEVLPYTIGAWSINQFPKNTEVNWSVHVHQLIRGGVGQNLSYYIASVHPNITVNGQSHTLACDCPLTVMLGWTEAVWYERFCTTPLVHGQLTSSPRTLKLIDLPCTNWSVEVLGKTSLTISPLSTLTSLSMDSPLTVMLGWTEAVWYERFCPTPLVHGQLTSSPRTLKLIDLYTCTNWSVEVLGKTSLTISPLSTLTSLSMDSPTPKATNSPT